MRIGFDAKRAFFNNTGLGNYSRDTINLLANYFTKNQFYIYTVRDNKNNRLSEIKERKNIFIKEPRSFLNKTFKSFWRSKSIVKDLTRDKIEIYHGLSNELPMGIETTSIKTIVTIHDLIFIRYPHLFNFIDKSIYYKKFKSACKRANKIIAVSQQTKNDIINFFNIPENKISVVYQGCNKIFQENIKESIQKSTILKYNIPKKYLLYVGSIEPRKNLLTILKTLTQLNGQNLVIIGNGKKYKQICLDFILKNKLENQVIILNKLSLEEMAIIYQNAEIMIYPSIFEGFGIPIIESLFSKTPVITSKDGCFKEAGGEHSKYINPLSVNEMKNAIIEIQNSKILQNKMTEQGFKHAQHFTNNKIANNLMEIYKSI